MLETSFSRTADVVKKAGERVSSLFCLRAPSLEVQNSAYRDLPAVRPHLNALQIPRLH